MDVLTMEELQEQYVPYAEIIGLGNLIRLTEVLGGSTIRVPQKKELLKNKVYQLIVSEFDGSNVKKLALKYQVSERTVYNILQRKAPKNQPLPAEHDMDYLQGNHREIAEIIGYSNLVRLSETFGGIDFYIPQKRKLFKDKKYKAILQEFDGTNLKKLAAKYQVSETTVYNIVRKKIKQRKRRSYTIEGQMTIADFLL